MSTGACALTAASTCIFAQTEITVLILLHIFLLEILPQQNGKAHFTRVKAHFNFKKIAFGPEAMLHSRRFKLGLLYIATVQGSSWPGLSS